MPDDALLPLDQLSSHDKTFVRESVDRVETAWRLADEPDLEPLAPDPSHPQHARALVEMLKCDLRYRWRTRRESFVGQYFGAWPELARNLEARRELIEAECVERAIVTGELSLDDLAERFPDETRDLPISHIARFVSESRRSASLDGRGRLLPIRKLGEGGMGAVYDVFDRERESRVAAKRLLHVVPERLYRFKQEFRALAELQHPNLVGLHQLLSDGEEWLLTMDLVEGCDFLQWVRGGDAVPVEGPVPNSHTAEATVTALSDQAVRESAPSETVEEPPVSALSPSALARLRTSMRQLAQGVAFLHANGKLHCDLKPANVLVQPNGQVRILDFGIVADLPASGEGGQPSRGVHQLGGKTDGYDRKGQVVGTVRYMAPEQLEGRGIGPAADWYAVGEMLFAGLSGRLPFTGGTSEVARAKLWDRAPSIRRYVSDVPDDLAALCDQLLLRDPWERPTGAEILSSLGAGDAPARDRAAPVSTLFVGREPEMRELRAGLNRVREGEPTTFTIHGQSGMGKSALLAHFLSELTGDPELVVLSGRCYEQEAVPYKGVDNLVDSLGSYLLALEPAEVDAVMPRHMASLSQMFPVLQSVEQRTALPRRQRDVLDAQELRGRASHALREILGRIGDRRNLVVLIDDLQWGDADSASLLIDLLRQPEAPRALTILCYRDEYADSSECLQMLREATRRGEAAGGGVLDLVVGPLPRPDALALSRQLCTAEGADVEPITSQVTEESGGSPYFILELARHFQRVPSARPEKEVLELDEVLWRRVQALEIPARTLIEVVAVAGRPIQLRQALDAADVGHDEWALVTGLRNEHLLRGSGPRLEDPVETYHDRVRESVISRLSEETRRQRHASLADVMRVGGDFDPETLATHLSAAGRDLEAAQYFDTAADQAVTTLAFDRAARLYRRCLLTEGNTGLDEFDLKVKLAGALANAGRGHAAAAVYEDAARLLPESLQRLDLERSAATQYCLSGHTDEGRVAFRRLTAAHGLHFPTNKMAQLLWLLWQRTKLRVRGLTFERVAEEQVPPDQIRKIDLLWAMSAGLSVPEGPAVAGLQTQGLLLALRAGEASRLARAFACEAFVTGATGWSVAAKCDELLERATELASAIDDPKALGMAKVAAGMVALLQMRYRDAATHSLEAERILTEECTGVSWEIATARTLITWSLWHRGEYRELSRRTSLYLNEARERGDLYTVTNLETVAQAFLSLADDDPDGADVLVDRSLAAWGVETFHLQHLSALYTRAHVLLYRGEGRLAYEHVTRLWPDLRRSLHLYTQLVRFTTHDLRGRTAIAAAHETGSAAIARRAQADARRLRRERTPWPSAHADTQEAGLALLRSQPEVAQRYLRSAIHGHDTLEQALSAAAARCVLGRLIGGDEGAALRRDGQATFHQQGIVKPDQFVAMLTFGPLVDRL